MRELILLQHSGRLSKKNEELVFVVTRYTCRFCDGQNSYSFVFESKEVRKIEMLILSEVETTFDVPVYFLC